MVRSKKVTLNKSSYRLYHSTCGWFYGDFDLYHKMANVSTWKYSVTVPWDPTNRIQKETASLSTEKPATPDPDWLNMSLSPANGWWIFTDIFLKKIQENNPTKGTCPGNLASRDSGKWSDFFTYTCANERCNHVPANKLMTWMNIPLVTSSSAIKLTLVTHNSKHHQKSWACTMHHFEAFRKHNSCTACQEYWPVFFIGHKWWRESKLASFFGGWKFPAREFDQPPA